MRMFARISVLALVFGQILNFPILAGAVGGLTITPITWGDVGLDSNDVTSGPNTFPVGARVCNTTAATVTGVSSVIAWDTVNANINIANNMTDSMPNIAAAACADTYYNSVITRTTAAWNTSKQFHITASATGQTSVSTPLGRQLLVHKLVSQNRNSITSVSGPLTVFVGQTYNYTLNATTSASYEQLNSFMALPQAIFHINSVTSTYTNPVATIDKFYADACGWDPVPTSPTYDSCIGPANIPGGKVGGTISNTYNVTIIGSGVSTLTPLVSDFSGASYHYNTDYNAPANIVALDAQPVANDDAYSLTANTSSVQNAATGVLANDLGTGISVTGHTSPTHGALVIAADGSFTYTPTANFAGTDTFTYTLTDSSAQTATATVTMTVNPPAAPVANNDSYSPTSNVTLNVAAPGVRSNDTGTGITVTAHTSPSHGTLTINSDGSFTYTSTLNYLGADSFTYTITDAFSRTATATVNLTVTIPVAPVANNDSYSTPFNTALVKNAATGVQANDTGTSLTTNLVSGPTHGTLTLNGDGSFTYTPVSTYAGADSFTYHNTDGFLRVSNTATVSLTVGNPAAPVANNDSYTTAYQTTLNVSTPGVLTNDTGTGTLTTALVTGPAHGALIFNSNGSFVYTPNAGYAGADSFTYHTSDTYGQTSGTATVSLTVGNPAAPIANNDSYTTAYQTALNVSTPGVLTNDTGTGTLTTALVTGPTHGALTFNSNGAFVYTPNAGYTGSDSFTYRTSDTYGQTSGAATVSLTVSLPATPIAVNDSYTTAYQMALNVLAPGVLTNDTGTETLTTSLVTGPTYGTLTFNSDGSFVYTPNAGYAGADSFTYRANDTFGQHSNTATVALTVSPPAPPVANNDSYSTPFQTTLNVSGSGVLTNDTGTGTLTTTLIGNPTHGTLTLNANGSFVYTPNSGWAGADTFSYSAVDSFSQVSPSATVTITTLNPPAPVANTDSYTTAYQTTLNISAPGVLINDTGTGTLTTALVTGPTHGTLTFNSDGSFIYTPNAGYVGADSFTYSAHDTFGQYSNNATVNLTISPPSPPVANNDSYSTAFQTTLNVSAPGVLTNDTGTGTLTTTLIGAPTHGTLTLNTTGSFVYTPNNGFAGTDSFTYGALDSFSQASSPATVTITTGNPATPVANNDSYVTGFNTTVNTVAPGVLGNDTGTGTLTTALVTGPTQGTLTFNSDGSFVYTPNAGYVGADSFTYQTSDTYGQTSGTATVNLTVSPPAAPVANNDSYTTAYQTLLNVPPPGVLANDTGTGTLTTALVTGPTHGILTFNSTGSFVYTPNAGYTGSDSFTYRTSDTYGQTSGTATVSLAVSLPAAPVAVNDSYTTAYQMALNVLAPGVLTNDTGTETLTTSLVTGPTYGTLTFNSDGSFVYTPNAGYAGADSFTYRANDTFGQHSNTATVALTVSPPAPPVANNDSYSTPFQTTLNVSGSGVLTNDTGTGTLTTTLIGNPTHGTLTLNANGSFVYTPNSGWAGADTFSYSAVDSFSQISPSATVTVTILNPPLPVANNDSYTTPFNTARNVLAPGLLSNDTGTGTLTTSLVTGPSSGSLTLNSDGSFSYTPNSTFAGSDSFTYNTSDTYGQTSGIATVNITVGNPAPPVANDDSYSTSFNTTVNVSASGVLTNDTGTGTLQAVLVSAPSSGSLTLNSDGSFSYTPNSTFAGADSFTYNVIDTYGQTSGVAIVNLTVDNPASPLASDDSYSTPFNITLNVSALGVLENDVGTGPLSANIVSGPSSGSLTLNNDGSFSYTPNATFAGNDSFTYNASDTYGQTSNTATVTITTDNPPTPIAVDDSYSTNFNTTLKVIGPGILANDSGTGTLTTSLVGGPSSGSLTLNSDGSFSYTPNSTFAGADSFTYQTSDTYGQTSGIATVDITVDNPAAPVANNDSYSTPFQTTLNVSGSGVLTNDTGTGTLTTSLISGPIHGTLTFNSNGSFVYTPNAGYAGAASFTYSVSDAYGQTSGAATVNITVDNPATPVANNDAYVTGFNTTSNAVAPGVLGNDTGTGSLQVNLVGEPSSGSLTLNSDGSFSYTPNATFAGSDSFTYNVSDTYGQTSNTATVTIDVSNPPAPIATPDTYTQTSGTTLNVPAPGVLGNDTGTGTLQANLVNSLSSGTLTLNTDGSLTYVPVVNASGTYAFTYDVTDSYGQTSNVVNVIININPVGVNDSYTALSNTALNIPAGSGVLANDHGTGLVVSANTSTSHGVVSVQSDGSFVYTSDTNYSGPDSFTYSATDSASQSVNGIIVSITVDPNAVNDAYTTGYNTTLTVPLPGVLANDGGSGLSVSSHTSPAHGTLTIQPNGSFVYVPTHNYSGSDSFTYTDTDSSSNTSSATVNLTVSPAPLVLIQGNVIHDANRNNVFDSGEGMGGVKVSLINSLNVTVATLTTDSGGNYNFANVAPGNYTIAVDPTTTLAGTVETKGPGTALNNTDAITVNGTPLTITPFFYAGAHLSITAVVTPSSFHPGDQNGIVTFTIINSGPSSTAGPMGFAFTPPSNIKIDGTKLPSSCTLNADGSVTCVVPQLVKDGTDVFQLAFGVLDSSSAGTTTGPAVLSGNQVGDVVSNGSVVVSFVVDSAATVVPSSGNPGTGSGWQLLGGFGTAFVGIIFLLWGPKRRRDEEMILIARRAELIFLRDELTQGK
jgi:hypothetical protein